MNKIENPYEQLTVGTAVTYEGLPTEVVSPPRDIMGVDVVLLRYVPWYVPVACKDIAIMTTPRQPTPAELQQHYQRNIDSKKYPI